jgi:DNA repair exonuclease SbcCD ATPase subunit
MILHSLKLSGIIPYRNPVEVQFDALGRIVAINGANGVGKSTLLECIPLAMYNLMPSRMLGKDAGTVYDCIFPNTKAYVELIFSVRGSKYRIVRNYTLQGEYNGNEFKEKHKDATAFIYRYAEKNPLIVDPLGVLSKWIPLAQQTRQVNDYIESEIISKQLFFASAFNSQEAAGDLIDVPVNERKQIFANMLNLEHLALKSKLFAERTKLIDTMIEKENNNMRIKESHIVNVDEVNAEIEAKELTLAGVESGIVTITAARDLIMANKAKADAVKDSVSEKQNQIRKYETRIFDLEKDRDNRQSKLNNEQKLQNQVKQIETLKTEIAALENQLKGKDEIYKKIEPLREQIPGLNEKRQALFDDRRNRLDAKNNELREAENIYREWQKEYDIYLRNKEAAKKLTGLECPKNCVYVSDAVESEKYVSGIKYNELINTGAAYEGAVLRLKNEAMNILNESVDEKANPFATKVQEIQKQIDALQLRLSGFDKVESDINKKKDELHNLESPKPSEALSLMDEHRKRIGELQIEIDETKASWTDLKYEVQEILSGATIDNYDEMLMANGAEKQRLELQRNSLTNAIAVLREKLMESAKAQFGKTIIENKINKLRSLIANYNRLSFAFGLKGIQALVIDSEKHQFLSIAKELFDILSDGKMQLQFETVKQNKDKTLREDFNLFVVIEGARVEVKFLSGAQKSMAKLIMRASLNIFNGQKNQGVIDTLILDEITGAYTAENRERFFTLLNYMSKFFHQVLLITHQDVAERIPCRIMINDKRELEIG